MSLLVPILAFSTGYLIANRQPDLKNGLAKLLSKFLIPFVIIYNMLFYQTGSMQFIAFSFVAAALLYAITAHLFKDKTTALCIAYPNLAWLGFPIAAAIFGDWASTPMVALYIGGSLFGNLMASVALTQKQHQRSLIVKTIISSPPILALVIAAILRVLDLQHVVNHMLLDYAYELSKWTMTLCGMLVLGMWLSAIQLSHTSIQQAIVYSGVRIGVGSSLCALVWWCFPFAQHGHVIYLLLMLFFLPPAANIVSLETYYAGTGHSAQYIAAGTVVSCVYLFFFYIFYHYVW